MSKLIDLTGRQFGRLTVIRRANDHAQSGGQRIPMWECLCSCGNTTSVSGVSLRSGNTKSCGCLQKELQKARGADKFIDLMGRSFGYLTVIDRGPNGPLGETMWRCRCSCGNETLVRSVCLRKGQTRSCGCMSGRLQGESRKRVNIFEFRDDCVVGFTSSGIKFYFDTEDYEEVKQYCWSVFGRGESAYIIARMGDGKNIFLHRLITRAREEEVVDHLNHNGFDNRKCNLRRVPQSKNMLNLRTRSNNTSGVSGVSWSKDRNKWEAYISFEGRRHHLGRFDSFDDAVAARKAAEEKYFGQYSYDNSMAAVPRVAV